jgi:hypothetical protein
MSGRKKAPVETNVDEQDDQEAAEAEVDALLESPERRRQVRGQAWFEHVNDIARE